MAAGENESEEDCDGESAQVEGMAERIAQKEMECASNHME